ncbi:MAG: hypothetical protein EBR82_41675 [Caulobacteraceae bacterium]|nr:hypothetical protein [Caulobacteraceae bacterium]
MAVATTILGPALFAIGASSPGTAYTDQVTSVTVVKSREALDQSSFGDTGRQMVGGLTNVEVTAELLCNDTAANALAALVGTRCYVAVRRSTGAISSSNVEYQVTGAYLESVNVVNASIGELQTLEISLSGGTLVEDTTP